jgi:hypothetical protein
MGGMPTPAFAVIFDKPIDVFQKKELIIVQEVYM